MSDKRPLISVLIPVYNAQKFLASCLDSVCSQSYSHIEIICINDGSTDASYNLLKQYAKKDSRIRVFCSSSHQGIANIRNLLLEKASGKYIAFVDADDIVSPQYLEVLYAEALRHNADIVRCLYDLWDTRANRKIPCEKRYKEFLRKEPDSKPINRLQAALDDTQVWLKLIRLEVVVSNQIKFLSNSSAEDISFEILLYQYADKICFVPQHLYTYRVENPQSLSSQKYLSAWGTLENLIFVTQELIKRRQTDSGLYTGILLLIFHAMRRLRKFSLPKEQQKIGALCGKGFVMIEQSLVYTSRTMRIKARLFCWLAHKIPDRYLPYLAYCMR